SVKVYPSLRPNLHKGQRTNRGASRSHELQRDADERETVHAIAGQLLQVHVLDNVDPFLREQVDVAKKGDAGFRIALVKHVPRHVVSGDGDDAVLRGPEAARL